MGSGRRSGYDRAAYIACAGFRTDRSDQPQLEQVVERAVHQWTGDGPHLAELTLRPNERKRICNVYSPVRVPIVTFPPLASAVSSALRRVIPLASSLRCGDAVVNFLSIEPPWRATRELLGALYAAKQSASRLADVCVRPEHLLLGLLDDDGPGSIAC